MGDTVCKFLAECTHQLSDKHNSQIIEYGAWKM